MQRKPLKPNNQLNNTVLSQLAYNQIQTKQYSYDPLVQNLKKLEQKASKDAAEIVQIAKDLSDSNQQLKEANKKLENFAYTVSHDLQEPLRSINIFAKLLEEEYGKKLDTEAKEYLSYIIGSATRMQTLVHDVLEYSRAGKNEQNWIETDLNELVKTVIVDLQRIIKETEAKIIVDRLPTLIVNPTEIQQLFRNLITNGIKFAGDNKPRVKITSKLQNKQWLISVKDNGIGIKAQHHDRVFLAFKKLHTHEQYPGSGVGLSICKKIVERHQGQIGVHSQLGIGSTFYFTLPIISNK